MGRWLVSCDRDILKERGRTANGRLGAEFDHCEAEEVDLAPDVRFRCAITDFDETATKLDKDHRCEVPANLQIPIYQQMRKQREGGAYRNEGVESLDVV